MLLLEEFISQKFYKESSMADKNQSITKEHSELLNTSKILIKDISQLIVNFSAQISRS
jgi:hypothetical protein